MKVYVNATQGEFILKFGCQALKQAKTQLDEDYRQQSYELQLIELWAQLLLGFVFSSNFSICPRRLRHLWAICLVS